MQLQALVDAVDLPALLRAVDQLVYQEDWDGMFALISRCEQAQEIGKQLWPVVQHIEYRVALAAPAPTAARVLRPGAARFALGPLTEVAASHLEWAALRPHLDNPAIVAAVAQERVLRGENLAAHPGLANGDLPPVLTDWEPQYALPRYGASDAAFPEPEAATRAAGPAEPLPAAPPLGDDDGVTALLDVVEAWTTQSNGTATAVVVDGPAEAAVGGLLERLGRPPRGALLPLSHAEALAVLQWCGASGGAYARRRGGAAGRFAAWWTAAALVAADWPPDPAWLGTALSELRWYRWVPTEPEAGWRLRMAVTDPVDRLAWAVEAVDHRAEDLAASSTEVP